MAVGKDRWRELVVVGVVAFAVRAAYAILIEPNVTSGLDRLWYEIEADLIAHGYGVIDPGLFVSTGVRRATAWRTPGFPVALVPISWAGGTHTAFVWFGVVLGSITCVLTAVLGSRLFGTKVGVIAGGLLAVHPLAVATDASVMSEVLAVPLVVVSLLFLTSATDAASDRRRASVSWVALGVAAAALAWVRPDATLCVAVAAVWKTALCGRRWAWAGLVAAAAAAAVLVAPWPIRNARTMDSFTMSTVASAGTLAGANCPSTWSGRLLGYWDPTCAAPPPDTTSEVEVSRALRRQAADHVRAEWPRLPIIATVRLMRTWGLWDPAGQTRLEAIEQRHLAWHRVGWVVGLGVVVLALASIVVGRRARVPVDRRSMSIVLGPALAVSLTAVAFYGNQRFRAPAEPLLCIAAALTVAAAFGRPPTSAIRDDEP